MQGAISGTDFARSLVGSVKVAVLEDYLDRVEALPKQLADYKVLVSAPFSLCLFGIGAVNDVLLLP